MGNITGIGKRLQKFRNEKHLTQQAVADMLDISPSYISNIETGKDLCSVTVMLGIINLYDVSFDYILGDNLSYNQSHPADNPTEALTREIGTLSAEECEHLLRYIPLLKKLSSDKTR